MEIDLLRIFCASLLFYFHVGLYTHWFLSSYATYASGTFIALAGYCAVRYSRHRKALTAPTVAGVSRFFLDRFLAVYPAYAFFTLLIFAGSFLYPASGRSTPFNLTELLANLLMVNQYFGIEYFTNMMWFIPFVLQLYLLVPFLCLIAKRASYLGLIACSILSLLGCLLVYWVAPAHALVISKEWSPLFRLAPAFVGVAFGLSTTPTILPGLLAIWISCSGARFLLLPWLPGLFPLIVRSFYSAFMLPLLLGLAWLTAISIRRWAVGLSGTIALLSKASLPFFITHGVMINFLWNQFGPNPWAWAAYFLLCWLGSILFVVAYVRIVTSLRERILPVGSLPVPSTGLAAH